MSCFSTLGLSVPTEQLVTWPTKVEEQVSTNLRLSHETVWQEERVSNCEWDLFLLVLLFLV